MSVSNEKPSKVMQAELAVQSPAMVLEIYFLDGSRNPDRTKTPDVLALQSISDVEGLHAACQAVAGLHSVSAGKYSRNMVFVGWDLEAVTDARRAHIVAAERLHINIHDAITLSTSLRHAEYLDRVDCKGSTTSKTPVGRYTLDCPEIVQEFGHLNSEMSLDVEETTSAGVFEASFRLRVIQGHIVMSADKKSVVEYRTQPARDTALKVCEDDKENCHPVPCASLSRKRPAMELMKTSHKKAKKSAAKPRKFIFKLAYRQAGGEETCSGLIDGAILFGSTNYHEFTCRMDVPGVGSNVHFVGRKVSDQPVVADTEWKEIA